MRFRDALMPDDGDLDADECVATRGTTAAIETRADPPDALTAA